MPSLRAASAAASAIALAALGLVDPVAGQQYRPNQYIVEYAPHSDALQARDSLASKNGIRMRKTFSSNVFSGASIETEDFDLDSLIAMPEVANVWRNSIHKLEPLAVEPSAVPFKELDYIVHNTTGVSKLHDAGILGEGAVVGVVDTGIWYEHPALGGCIGPECKVLGGYDLVGDAPWHPGLQKAPDEDPRDNQGHGTHVSGIVAGENDYWSGVAPKAKIRAYKVFSAENSPESDDETVIEAFLMAAADGCDIITCSIGNFNGWPQNAWAVVSDRLVSEGIFVSVSAGNEGSAGPFFGSTGSSGKDAIAVASIAADKLPARSWKAIYSPEGATNETVTEAYLPATGDFPATVNGLEIVPMTFDTSVPDDACTPFPAGTPRLDNVIPLVRRGSCTFVVKAQNLADIGAKYILFYNNAGTITTPQSVPGVLAAMLTAETGAKIIDIVQAGGVVTGDFSSDSEIPAFVDWPAAGRASDFTSWGALNDLTVKPDIGAPGGQIYSTYLDNTYAVLSGTSMACPYVAGVAALWVSQYGGRKANDKSWARTLGRRIISSGQPIPWYIGGVEHPEFIAPVEQVGSGLIDGWKVLNYDTQLDFKTIGLNDTRHFSRYHDVTVTNTGKDTVLYQWSHAPAAGIETYTCEEADCRVKVWTELEAVEMVVDVTLPRSFTLKPGQSKKVSVNFANPENKGWNEAALPAYSGNIRIKGSNGDELSVPYFGLAADLKEVVGSIHREGYPTAVSKADDTPIEEDSVFTFDFSEDVLDFPRITTRLKWGSAQIRWDIFESTWTERKWTWPLVPGQNGYIGSVHGLDKSTGSVDYPNVTVTFPIEWVNRNGDTAENQLFHEYWWPEGKLGDGNTIAPGNYTMRFAALNPFGVPQNGDNWSVFKTPKITVA